MLQFAYCVYKYRMKNLVFLFLLVFSAQILGQGLQFKFNHDIIVSNGKAILKNPWAGGLNAVQFTLHLIPQPMDFSK